MIKLVAFDLDGTVGDTIPMCIAAFKRAISPYTSHELSDEEVIQTFGLNEEGMIRQVVNEAHWQEALNRFYVLYREIHDVCPQPFEGIAELINALKKRGVIVALITGKGAKSCEITLQQFGMTDIFDRVLTGSAERNIKSDALRDLLQAYHLSVSEVVYVGDTISDIAACHEAYVKCFSAAWSVPQDMVRVLEKHNPDNVFCSIQALSNFLVKQIETEKHSIYFSQN